MRLQRSGRRRRSLSSALPTALLRGGAPKKRARERRRGAGVGPARGAILPRGERRRPTMQKVLIALFATGAAAVRLSSSGGFSPKARALSLQFEIVPSLVDSASRGALFSRSRRAAAAAAAAATTGSATRRCSSATPRSSECSSAPGRRRPTRAAGRVELCLMLSEIVFCAPSFL